MTNRRVLLLLGLYKCISRLCCWSRCRFQRRHVLIIMRLLLRCLLHCFMLPSVHRLRLWPSLLVQVYTVWLCVECSSTRQLVLLC